MIIFLKLLNLGVVKNARTNKDLTFIDDKLKAFEAKIKEGNLPSHLPEAYFQWHLDIKTILSGIIVGSDTYLKSKHVGENVDPTAFTGRKSAVIDVKDQALNCQKLALRFLS